MTKKTPALLLFNGRIFKTRLLTPTNKTVLVYDKEVRRNFTVSNRGMNADSKSHVKSSEMKVGTTSFAGNKDSRNTNPHAATKFYES